MAIGYEAIGKPIPAERKENAYLLLQEIGVTDKDVARELVTKVANLLERDRSFEALETCLKVICLTGAYRFIATLLT